jgi:hypothetical protein
MTTTTTPEATKHPGQVLLSVAVVLLGTALAYGTSQLPEASGYAKVGPRLMPSIVSAALFVLGLLLLKYRRGPARGDSDQLACISLDLRWTCAEWFADCDGRVCYCRYVAVCVGSSRL